MTEAAKTAFPLRALLLATIAWLLPASGHLLLGKRFRAFGFVVVLLVAFGLGLQLQGNLYRPTAGSAALLPRDARGDGHRRPLLRGALRRRVPG